MISKYFQNYCHYYLSRYSVTKKKFENILKRKISKDFFQKKISIDQKIFYEKEINDVVEYFSNKGFFNEKRLLEINIDSLLRSGKSLKKIEIFLVKNFFDKTLIKEKINDLQLNKNIDQVAMEKYLFKSGVLKKNSLTSQNDVNFEKIVKKFINQGFDYNESINFLKSKIKKNE